MLCCILALCLPHVGQDTITTEDIKFREYLESKGWDTNQLGVMKGESVESRREAGLPVPEAAEEKQSEKVTPQ
jgi:hypothetical protein